MDKEVQRSGGAAPLIIKETGHAPEQYSSGNKYWFIPTDFSYLFAQKTF